MGEQLSGECKEASGAETSGKDTDSNDVVHESKSKQEVLDESSGLTPLMKSLNVGVGGNKSKPKPKRVRKMSKGKGVSSSTSDGNGEHSTPELVENLEGNGINTIDAPGRMDSAVMSGNEDSQAGAGDGEKDVKASDSKSDSLS